MDVRAPLIADADLVAQVVLGDEGAFAVLYDRHVATIFGAALRLLRDRQAAEEVVQETWLALWNRAERYDASAGSLVGWLLAIARNRAVDRLRAAGRRPQLVPLGAGSDDSETSSEALDRAIAAGEPVASGPREHEDPSLAAMRSWERSVVRAAVAVMPDLERQTIQLAYDEGLTQVEIAERLGWPLGTVKTRTRRGLARLRAALEGTFEVGADAAERAPVRGNAGLGEPSGAVDGPR